MIYVDDRAGSKDYAQWIPNSELTRLDFGDVAFRGNGRDGSVLVGIELKSLGDVLNCITTGRFADVQAPGMIESYDQRFLIVEGTWTADDSGILVYPGRRQGSGMVPVRMGRRQFMYGELEGWFTSVEIQAGIRVRRTVSKRETVATILAIYHWFQRDYAEHKTFKCLHDVGPDVALLTRPTMFRHILAKLPHVGWERSAELQSRVSRIQFLDRNGQIMNGKSWFIPNQIAEKAAKDIDKACENANTNHT